jgi:SulP family sulfate permease
MFRLFSEWAGLLRVEFKSYDRSSLQKDLLAGLTVAAVALPLALAFGVASGADAAAGLVTAILAGILIGLFSGAPYQISGPTGAMTAVLIVLATRYGMEGVWLAGLLSGVVILLLAVFRLGRVVALIPAPVISGFTSGIALIIVIGQIDNLLGTTSPPAENILLKFREFLAANAPSPDPHALLISLIVVAVMIVWPRLPGGFWTKVPGSLAAIIIASGVALAFGWQVPEIGTIPRSILLENRFRIGEVEWTRIGEFVVPAMSIAALGAIESLLCGAVAGNMTGIRMHNSVELLGQGIGNVVIPFFGGVPATAAIARTSVNVKSGGVTRLTSIFHGLALLAAALAIGPLIGRIPLAALAGVLVVTAWRMNEWGAIRFYFGNRLRHAMLAFAITLAATVLLDLTQAILIGFGISTLIFMAQMSDLSVGYQPVDVERLEEAGHRFIHPEHRIGVYYVSGPLFFAAARKLVEVVETHSGGADTLILSLRGVPLVDATGVEVLRELWHRQKQGGGDVLLASVTPRVERLLERMRFIEQIGRERIFWSADRAILSLGAPLPDDAPVQADGETTLDSGQEVMPHVERSV